MPNVNKPVKLSLVMPCYNESGTLRNSVERALSISGDYLSLELIIVDDASTDDSLQLARQLEREHTSVKVLHHPCNRGKGAALHTGFAHASGQLVGIHDADEEYNPADLPRLIEPIVAGKADVVYGSRYRKDEPRRVLYFWHSTINRILTLISNMFTDMDLTDMETCYKVFRREVIQSLDLREKRFGFEPEVTAKLAYQGFRVYEMGISYSPRTYEEGKKIGWKDAVHALYCIFHYGASLAPAPVQLFIYVFIGGIAGICNILFFLLFREFFVFSVVVAAAVSYLLAALVNYLLCVALLFRHKARWNTGGELLAYFFIVMTSGLIDVGITDFLVRVELSNFWAKACASLIVLAINFLGRKNFVFKEKPHSSKV